MDTETKDLYSGQATVEEVDFTDLRFTDGLTEEEAASGFLILLKMKPENPFYKSCYIELEYSARECTGNLAGKKRSDIAFEQLKRFKLIDNDDISTVGNAVGRVVNIYQKCTQSKNGQWYVYTYLGGGFNKLSRDEVAKRIAMMTGRSVNQDTTTKQNPFF